MSTPAEPVSAPTAVEVDIHAARLIDQSGKPHQHEGDVKRRDARTFAQRSEAANHRV